jgi:ribulose-phosphate 3-epimerase
MPTIIPAILTNDIEDYRSKLAAINNLATDIQIDITDSQFVPSQTLTINEISSVPRKPKTELHLMTYSPEQYFDACAQAKFDNVLFHFEAVPNVPSPQHEVNKVITFAKIKNIKIGLVLNPDTPIEVATQFDQYLTVVQLMGVHPGFYGRPFIPKTLDRLRALRKLLRHAILEVDGGVKAENIVEVAKTGVDRIVVGSGIFADSDPAKAYRKLQKLIH